MSKARESYSAVLPLPEKAKDPTSMLAVMAMPAAAETIDPKHVIRLDDKVDADGKLTWSVPAGEWSITDLLSAPPPANNSCARARNPKA